MIDTRLSRRDSLTLLGAAGAGAALATGCKKQQIEQMVQDDPRVIADRIRRMKWWHEAKFGMFIHFGLFTVLGKDVWNFEREGWTMAEYEPFIKQFNPVVSGSPVHR